MTIRKTDGARVQSFDPQPAAARAARPARHDPKPAGPSDGVDAQRTQHQKKTTKPAPAETAAERSEVAGAKRFVGQPDVAGELLVNELVRYDATLSKDEMRGTMDALRKNPKWSKGGEINVEALFDEAKKIETAARSTGDRSSDQRINDLIRTVGPALSKPEQVRLMKWIAADAKQRADNETGTVRDMLLNQRFDAVKDLFHDAASNPKKTDHFVALVEAFRKPLVDAGYDEHFAKNTEPRGKGEYSRDFGRFILKELYGDQQTIRHLQTGGGPYQDPNTIGD